MRQPNSAGTLTRPGGDRWSSFGLGIGGSAVALAVGNPVGAGLAFASGLLGLKRQADPASGYTYLFQVQSAWPPRA